MQPAARTPRAVKPRTHRRQCHGSETLQRPHPVRERPLEIAKITLDGIHDRRGRSLQLKRMYERLSKEATEMEGPKDLRGQ